MQETALTVAPANIINAYKYNFTPRMEHLGLFLQPICQPLPAREAVERERVEMRVSSSSLMLQMSWHTLDAVIDI